MDIPEGATVPQDHHAPAVAAVIDDDELLADVIPLLTPPNKLRIRQRNKIMKLALGLREYIPEAEEGAESVEISTDDMDPETLNAFLDVLAEVDDFAESIATDKDQYIAWADGASYEAMSALLSRYSSAVGESSSSSS